MSPDRVSNPGRLAFESDPPLTPLRGPARVAVVVCSFTCTVMSGRYYFWADLDLLSGETVLSAHTFSST